MLVAAMLTDSALGQGAEGPKTIVQPLDGEEILKPCEYQLFVPHAAEPVRAVWTIWDRGQDYLKWFHDAEVRRFAGEFRLALVLAAHCRSKEREDMIVIPEKGVGRALFTALDQFADSEKRPELRRVAVIHMGWSGAGSLAARMAGYRTERYLAGIDYAPGQYDPLGMDTIELDRSAIRAPQLIVANGADRVNGTERPYGYFKRYFLQGAPWTFVVQNATPHCCLQNAQALILEWLRAVLTGRLNGGQFGYLTPQDTDVRDEWKLPVFGVTKPRIAKRRNAAHAGEILGGWLPSPTFERLWIEFERRQTPIAVWKP